MSEKLNVDQKVIAVDVVPETVTAQAADRVETKPKRTWRSYLWDTFDKSPEERKFLFKLDAALLTFASLGYFIK